MDNYKTRYAQQMADLYKGKGMKKPEIQKKLKQDLKDFDVTYGTGQSFWKNLANAIVSPLRRTSQNIYTGTMALAEPERLSRALNAPEEQTGIERALLKPKAELERIDVGRRGETGLTSTLATRGTGKEYLEQGVKPSGALAMMGVSPGLGKGVPLGLKTGAQVFGKGALIGGAQQFGLTPGTATAGETGRDVGIAGGVAGVTAVGAQALSQWAGGKMQARKLAQARQKQLKAGGYIPETVPERLGTDTLQAQMNTPAGLARGHNPPKTYAQMSDYGYPNVRTWKPIASRVTGSNGKMTKLVRSAVAQSDEVDLTGISKVSDDLIAYDTGMDERQAVKAVKYVNDNIAKVQSRGAQGSLSPNADPELAFAFSQQLENKGRKLLRGTPQSITPAQRSEASFYFNVADELQDRIFYGQSINDMVEAGFTTGQRVTRDEAIDQAKVQLVMGNKGTNANDAVKKMITPELVSEMSEISPDLGEQVAQLKFSTNASADARSLQKVFVDASILSDEGMKLSPNLFYNPSVTSGRGAGRYIPSLKDPLASIRTLLSTPDANARIGQALRNLGQSPGYRGGMAVAGAPFKAIGGLTALGQRGITSLPGGALGRAGAITTPALRRAMGLPEGNLPQPRPQLR